MPTAKDDPPGRTIEPTEEDGDQILLTVSADTSQALAALDELGERAAKLQATLGRLQAPQLAPPPAEAAKPFEKSLTVQGAGVMILSALATAYGPLAANSLGLDAADAGLLAHSSSGVLAVVGAIMALVGRMRLGDLR